MSQSQFSWLSKLTLTVLVLNLLVIEGDSVYQMPYCKVNPFNCVSLKQKLAKVSLLFTLWFITKYVYMDTLRTQFPHSKMLVS